MERKLASVQIISDLQPIPEADLIEVATVQGWKLVVKKGEFQVGQKAIYCEIDSFLPIAEQFEFLRKSSYRKMGEQEGFRLKTIKLRGQVSQGLLLPLDVLTAKEYDTDFFDEGNDVTDILNIIKWEPPIPAQLAGKVRGNFPSFIPKTDEERVQNLTKYYDNYRSNLFYVTEKLDGSSATFYFNNGLFGVCSRNLDLLETEGNSFWFVARTLHLEAKLQSIGNFALQGELIGESIQGNPYKLRGQSVSFFNAFNIDTQCYLPYNEFVSLMSKLELKSVPFINNAFTLPEKMEDLLSSAEGKSVLHADAEREGIVVRSHDRKISFKVISNRFLLKEKQFKSPA